MEQVAFDCSVLEFYESITKQPILLGRSEVVSINKYFPNKMSTHSTTTWTRESKSHPLYYFLSDNSNKLVVCGFSQDITITEYHLYFNSCTKDEIDKIIKTIIQSNISGYNKEGDNIFYIFYGKITLILHLDENKDIPSIIQSLSDSSMKLCWSSSGYHCTVVAAVIRIFDFSSRYTREMYDRQKVDIKQLLYDKYRQLRYNVCKDVQVLIFHNLINILVTEAKIMLVEESF